MKIESKQRYLRSRRTGISAAVVVFVFLLFYYTMSDGQKKPRKNILSIKPQKDEVTVTLKRWVTVRQSCQRVYRWEVIDVAIKSFLRHILSCSELALPTRNLIIVRSPGQTTDRNTHFCPMFIIIIFVNFHFTSQYPLKLLLIFFYKFQPSQKFWQIFNGH